MESNIKTDKKFPHIIIQKIDRSATQRRIVAYNDDGDRVDIIIHNVPIGKNRFKETIYKLDITIL